MQYLLPTLVPDEKMPRAPVATKEVVQLIEENPDNPIIKSWKLLLPYTGMEMHQGRNTDMPNKCLHRQWE